MFCPNCGNQVGDNDNVCSKCGAPLEKSGQPGAQQTPPSNNYGNPYDNTNGGYNNYNNGNYNYNRAPVSQTNGYAIAGFVLSFFIWILGLIFSVMGYNRSKLLGGSGRGLAIAGIVISIVSVVMYFIIIIASVSMGAAVL